MSNTSLRELSSHIALGNRVPLSPPSEGALGERRALASVIQDVLDMIEDDDCFFENDADGFGGLAPLPAPFGQ